jgi:formylglycine-generating enzyme required for sulfatase activity
MVSNISAELKNLLDEKGLGLLSNPRLLRAILLDICPTATSEINLLLIALQETIPQDIVNYLNNTPKETFVIQLADRLVSNYCIQKNKALVAVEIWAYALNFTLPPNNLEKIRPQSLSVGSFKTTDNNNSKEILKISDECSIEFIKIEPGKFLMGSSLNQRGRMPDELEVHEVTISKPFYISVYPITCLQFETIEGYLPPSLQSWLDELPKKNLKPDLSKIPVHCINASKAIRFCVSLSHQFNLPPSYILAEESSSFKQVFSSGFRLPTEAEWEYVCRAGTTSMFPWSDKYDFHLMNQYCLYNKSPQVRNTLINIGTRKANSWGLYDMLGLTWELTDDRNEDDYLVKGGSGFSPWGHCKPSSRAIHDSACGQLVWGENRTRICLGFRIVRFADHDIKNQAELIQDDFLLSNTSSNKPTATSVIASFSGAGNKKTKPFTTAGAWEVHWLAESPISLSLHNMNGNWAGMEEHQLKPGRGSSFCLYSGKYYLRVVATGPWAIKIIPLASKA